MKAKSKHVRPQLRPAAVLARLAKASAVGLRLRLAAESLLDSPYVSDGLIGGPDQAERLVSDLGGFDCVTFVESALALARSARAGDFRQELRHLRYRDGLVSYTARLHYFSDWLRANDRRGAIRLRTRGVGAKHERISLALLPDFPPRRVRLDWVPKAWLKRAQRRLDAAAIVAFASTRPGLDFFHTGLIFADAPGQPLAKRSLIHASASAGRVIAEPLAGFLQRNRMRGIAFATPLPPGDHP